jgi:hypothetical protein
MSTSQRQSGEGSVHEGTLRSEPALEAANGRDERGRFAPGNAGGPGNPFARRVAQLRKVLLDAVSDEDLQIVAEQLVVKAKMGDLVATKLLFQYVLGKPAATVDPDALDVEEFKLYQRAPLHDEMADVIGGRVAAEVAAGLLRQVVPYTGRQDAAATVAALKEAFPEDAENFDEEEDDEDFEEEEVVEAQPSTNGGTSADPRRRATPRSTNGPTSGHEPARRESGNSDNGGRLPDAPPRGWRPQLET